MHENIKQKKGYWKSFDDTTGLIYGCLRLLEDGDGNIWIGASTGLSRYDGKRFLIFTQEHGLASNYVSCIHQDRDSNIWIGTEGNGLDRYDGKRFVNFTRQDGLASNHIICVYQDRGGNIWIGTEGNGLDRYDGKEFVNFIPWKDDGLAGYYVSCIHQDRDGNIWIGTENGLSRYDGKKFVKFSSQDGLAEGVVRCICQDRDGNIWIGTENGLSRYDGKKFVKFNSQDGLAEDDVRCICQDRDGNIWIGTNKSGVSCYDGNEFVNFDTKDGLSSNNVHSIIEDREGSLWFTCEHGGISRYNPYEISYISDESVNEVMIKDRYGSLWWGFNNILSRYDGNDVNHHHFKTDIRELFEDSKGQLWVGTSGEGIFIYDNIKSITRNSKLETRNLTVDDGLVDNAVWRIKEYRQGHIWIGTRGGVSCYNGEKFVNFTTDDGLGSKLVSVICQDKSGRLWFAGFNGGGITSYDGKSFHRYTTDDGLADNRVVCMIEDNKNNLWMGTHNGISCYNGKSFKNYTIADGLLGSLVQRMLQDSRGQLWITTLGGGISRFDGKNFQALTTEDGLPSNSVSGIIEDADGSFIISTYKGTCRYTPDYKTPPLMRIDEVEADKIYEVSKKPEDIQISESVASIKIRYRGISFKTMRMRYNYILEGYDKDWKATWDEEVRYENLPVGEYSFKVIAINRDLVYSENPAKLSLKVIADPRDKLISELEAKVRKRTKGLEEANEALRRTNEKLNFTLDKIREAEAKYRTLVEQIPAIIYIDTLDAVTIYISPQVETILGYSQEACLAGSEFWLKLLHPDDQKRVQSEYERSRIRGEPLSSEYRLMAKDGRLLWVKDEAVVVKDDAGQARFIQGIIFDITERKLAEETITNLAHRDFLTNLPNRLLFKDHFNLALAHAKRDKHMVAVIFLDLDNFKNINDTLGHEIGDEFLKKMAECLTSLLREGDTIARWGGDEFTLLIPEIAQAEDAAKIAQRIIDTVRQPLLIGGHELHTTASLGIAIYPNNSENAETLLTDADIAMYQAKKWEKNNYRFYDPTMSAKILERQELENRLLRALGHEEFVVYYQPQVDINTGHITGVEALIRWQHPERGLLSPEEFISIAEESGLIFPIGEWVLRTACIQNKAWQAAGFPPVYVTVNLSARQFQQRNLVETIDWMLKETGLDGHWLGLEITESVAMQDVDYAIKILGDLREMGIKILMDDFGIGYSSLNHLKYFPFNGLKIDRSFVCDIPIDPYDVAVVKTIIVLAKNLRLKVIAEGVEKEEQLLFLKEQGCDEIQGYLFSKPLPAEELEKMLIKGTKVWTIL